MADLDPDDKNLERRKRVVEILEAQGYDIKSVEGATQRLGDGSLRITTYVLTDSELRELFKGVALVSGKYPKEFQDRIVNAVLKNLREKKIIVLPILEGKAAEMPAGLEELNDEDRMDYLYGFVPDELVETVKSEMAKLGDDTDAFCEKINNAFSKMGYKMKVPKHKQVAQYFIRQYEFKVDTTADDMIKVFAEQKLSLIFDRVTAMFAMDAKAFDDYSIDDITDATWDVQDTDYEEMLTVSDEEFKEKMLDIARKKASDAEHITPAGTEGAPEEVAREETSGDTEVDTSRVEDPSLGEKGADAGAPVPPEEPIEKSASDATGETPKTETETPETPDAEQVTSKVTSTGTADTYVFNNAPVYDSYIVVPQEVSSEKTIREQAKDLLQNNGYSNGAKLIDSLTNVSDENLEDYIKKAKENGFSEVYYIAAQLFYKKCAQMVGRTAIGDLGKALQDFLINLSTYSLDLNNLLGATDSDLEAILKEHGIDLKNATVTTVASGSPKPEDLDRTPETPEKLAKTKQEQISEVEDWIKKNGKSFFGSLEKSEKAKCQDIWTKIKEAKVLTDDELTYIQEAINAYRASVLNKKIDKEAVVPSDVLKDLKKTDGKKVPADELAVIDTSVPKTRTSMHLPEKAGDSLLSSVEAENGVKERIVTEILRTQIDKLYKELGVEGTYKLGSDGKAPKELSTDEVRKEVVKVAELMARKKRLEARADALKVEESKKPKYKFTSIDKVADSLDKLEASVIISELGGKDAEVIVGEIKYEPIKQKVSDASNLNALRELQNSVETYKALKAKQRELIKMIGQDLITYSFTEKGKDGKDKDRIVTRKISEISDSGSLEFIEGQIKPEDKKAKGKKIYDGKAIATYVKEKVNIENCAKLVAKAAKKDGDLKYINAVKKFISTAQLEDKLAAIGDDARVAAAYSIVQFAWKTQRAQDLKSKINGEKFKAKRIDGGEIVDKELPVLELTLAEIEDYISRVDSLNKHLSGAEGETIEVKPEDLGDLDRLVKGAYKNAGAFLKILLDEGFSVKQAENIANDPDLKKLAGMAGTTDSAKVTEAVKENSAKLKIMSSNPGTKWEDLDDAILAYYKKASEEEKAQLEAKYLEIKKKRTAESLNDDAEHVVSGLKVGEVAKFTFDDSMVEGLDVASLEKLLAETTLTGIDKAQFEAKVEMLKAVIAYKDADSQKKSGLATAAAREQAKQIGAKRDDAVSAIEKYLIITDIQKYASEIQNYLDDNVIKNYERLKTEELNGEIRIKFENLRKAIFSFNIRVEQLKNLLGESEVEELLKSDLDTVESAKELSDKAAPYVKTLSEMVKEKEAEESKEVGFSIEAYKEELKSKVSGKTEMETSVATLIGDDQETNYKKWYNLKYGKDDGKGGKTDEYTTTLNAMRQNGGLDALYDEGIFDDTWFNNYAASLAVTILSVLNSVETKAELDADDCANYAHIMIMVELDSKQLNKALEKALKPANYQRFVKTFMSKVKKQDLLRESEGAVALIEQLKTKMESSGISRRDAGAIVKAAKDAHKVKEIFYREKDGRYEYDEDVLNRIASLLSEGKSIDEVLNELDIKIEIEGESADAGARAGR